MNDAAPRGSLLNVGEGERPPQAPSPRGCSAAAVARGRAGAIPLACFPGSCGTGTAPCRSFADPPVAGLRYLWSLPGLIYPVILKIKTTKKAPPSPAVASNDRLSPPLHCSLSCDFSLLLQTSHRPLLNLSGVSYGQPGHCQPFHVPYLTAVPISTGNWAKSSQVALGAPNPLKA